MPQDGIYIPTIAEASAQLMLKGHDAIEALVGLSKSGLQYHHEESTTWVLVERIADEGGNFYSIELKNLKVYAGEPCPHTGYWCTFAKENSRQYFKQGNSFPDVNSDWGKVYWQFDREI